MNARPKSANFDLEQQWALVKSQLRSEYGDTAYRTWLASLTLEGLEGARVCLSVPTRFLRDWLASHYADRITVLWRRACGAVDGIALTVAQTPSKVSRASEVLSGPARKVTELSPAAPVSEIG
ncbi:MAG: DnaA N-terminal domain-containing protein, partial [Geminicoccaceae bacterium]